LTKNLAFAILVKHKRTTLNTLRENQMPRWKPVKRKFDGMEVRVHLVRNGLKISHVAKELGVTTAAVSQAIKGIRPRMLERVVKHVRYKEATTTN
jgi:hypothetical protein